ncbi:MAG: HesA/MoeB/ThiF family protein [Bacteroidota bacterium]
MNVVELKRYDRQTLLPELGIEGQQKLKDAAVLVIGAGGLGSPVLLYLAAAGVGRIGVTDHDVVEESNLQRQILYNTDDLGKNKATTAVEKLKLLNPYVTFEAYPFKLIPENAGQLIGSYDLILDGSDNFPTRYLVNDTCVALGKPLVFGSILGFEGQISTFNYHGGPDYRQLYPEPPTAEDAPNCGESGVIGTLPGIIGTYMANEAIKLLAGFGETLSGKLMTIDALGNEVRIFKLQFKVRAAQTTPSANPPQLIDASDLAEWLKNGEDFALVDVRETYEYDEKNIGGINIPVYELPGRINELPASEKLVFVCNTGKRSKMAAALVSRENRMLQVFIINI